MDDVVLDLLVIAEDKLTERASMRVNAGVHDATSSMAIFHLQRTPI
jgi:hypothetical protein